MTTAERAAVLDTLDRVIEASGKALARATRDSGIDLTESAKAVNAVLVSAKNLVAGAVVTDPETSTKVK